MGEKKFMSRISSDYCLTTILKKAKKAGNLCAAKVSRLFDIFRPICAKALKPLRRKAFSFDCLRTPTPKAAGSNPVGHTIRWKQFGYFKRNA